jgi:hypothetical protein
MKTYQFKNLLFEYFYSKFIENYPEFTGKVFRERLKINKPEYPYLIMKSGERTRINKRFEKFRKNDIDYVRASYRISVNFSVHVLEEKPLQAEMLADEAADFIEEIFLDRESTHVDLRNSGIVINEELCSGIRDKSEFSKTAQEFIRDINIIFEFEHMKTESSELAKEIETNVVFKK